MLYQAEGLVLGCRSIPACAGEPYQMVPCTPLRALHGSIPACAGEPQSTETDHQGL